MTPVDSRFNEYFGVEEAKFSNFTYTNNLLSPAMGTQNLDDSLDDPQHYRGNSQNFIRNDSIDRTADNNDMARNRIDVRVSMLD